MNSTSKTKLCWNCEGRVSLDLENCPYCAVYLGPAEENHDHVDAPYQNETDELSAPNAPFSAEAARDDHAKEVARASANEIKLIAIPLGFLLSGTVFFLFGLVLYLFSHQGMLTLHWNGRYWFIYLGLALPMLFLGWRALQRLEEAAEASPTVSDPIEDEQDS
jgi:hypothetical protein